MSEQDALWVSNDTTRVYRTLPGEPIQMKNMRKRTKQLEITVNKNGLIIAEETISINDINEVAPRIVISFYAVYFVEILLKNGAHIMIYHMEHEGTLSELPKNLDSYLLLVALSEMRNIKPPPFENPQTRGKWALRLVLFWMGLVISGLITRGIFLLAVSAIPLCVAGYLILNDGLKYRRYQGGKNLAWAGLFLVLLAMLLFMSSTGMFGSF